MPVLPEVASISVSPGLIVAALLGAPDHADRRPVLHRAGRVVAFELAEDDVAALLVVGAGQALQAHQRRVADRVFDRRVASARRRSWARSAGMPWCLGSESNRHSSRNGILSPARLPISPPRPGARQRRRVCHSGGRRRSSVDSGHPARAPPRMPPLPPVTQALLLANVAVVLPRRSCSAGGCSSAVRAVAARQRLPALAGRQLRVPARQLRATCSSTCSACGCSAPSSSASGARSASCSSMPRACSRRR